MDKIVSNAKKVSLLNKRCFPFCQAMMKMISCLGTLSSGMSNTLPPNEKKVLEQVNKGRCYRCAL